MLAVEIDGLFDYASLSQPTFIVEHRHEPCQSYLVVMHGLETNLHAALGAMIVGCIYAP